MDEETVRMLDQQTDGFDVEEPICICNHEQKQHYSLLGRCYKCACQHFYRRQHVQQEKDRSQTTAS